MLSVLNLAFAQAVYIRSVFWRRPDRYDRQLRQVLAITPVVIATAPIPFGQGIFAPLAAVRSYLLCLLGKGLQSRKAADDDAHGKFDTTEINF